MSEFREQKDADPNQIREIQRQREEQRREEQQRRQEQEPQRPDNK